MPRNPSAKTKQDTKAYRDHVRALERVLKTPRGKIIKEALGATRSDIGIARAMADAGIYPKIRKMKGMDTAPFGKGKASASKKGK